MEEIRKEIQSEKNVDKKVAKYRAKGMTSCKISGSRNATTVSTVVLGICPNAAFSKKWVKRSPIAISRITARVTVNTAITERLM